MEIVLLIARLLLAVVFGVAGIAKAADLAGSRRAIAGFGVPKRLASPLGLGLPFTEILIAVALIPVESAWLGAIAASALLLIFSIGIAVNLARGQSPDCRCFGQLHSEPVGWSTFARNLMLLAVAGLVVVQGKDNSGLNALNWLGDLRAGEIINLVVSVVAVAFLAVTFVFLRRVLNQNATILERIDAMKKVIDEDYVEHAPVERADAVAPVDGLPVGAPAPKFSLPALDGSEVSLEGLLGLGKPLLLVFVSPGCFSCKTLLPAIRVWERDFAAQFNVALVSPGTVEENRSKMAKYGAKNFLLEGETRISEQYDAKWTPAAVIINGTGRIASQTAYGVEEINKLVKSVLTASEAAPRPSNGNRHHLYVNQISDVKSLLKIGEPAPTFSLPDKSGRMVAVDDFLGRDTLVLFWHPLCAFCKAIFNDLKKWEEDRPRDAPKLLVITTGDEQDVMASGMNFLSPTLLDLEFDVAPLFGARHTPSAVIIDRDGKVASSVASGVQQVLALAGIQKAQLQQANF